MDSSNSPSTATMLEVVTEFSQARASLFAILDELSSQSERLGPAAVSQKSKLQDCKRAVADDQAECGVVGAEGVGKSTLINAIMNESREIVPTEKHKPGTVAPIYIRYGAGTVNYVVVTADASGHEKRYDELSLPKFREFALQRYNPNNEKGVVRLEVYIENALLKGGITLVDIPGGEGVSVEVAHQTATFLANREHAVIGVVRNRASYGALKRLIGNENLVGRAGALIYNTTAEDLYSDGTPASAIADARAGFVDSIAAGQPAQVHGALRAKTFVTNVRNLATMSAPRDDMEAALAEEGRMALSQIGRVMQTRSLLAVLSRGIAKTLHAVAGVEEAVNRRKRVIQALREGKSGASEVQEARFAVQQARQTALGTWDDDESNFATRESDRSGCGQIQIETLNLRSRILNELGDIKHRWETALDHDEIALHSLKNEVEAVFLRHASAFQAIWEETFIAATARRVSRRAKLTTEALVSIKFFSEVTSGVTTMKWQHDTSAPALMVDNGDDVRTATKFAGAMGTMAAKMAATGIGVKVAWIPAVLGAVAGIYAGILHLLRGGDKGAGRTLLIEVIQKCAKSLPSPEEEAQKWQAAIAEMTTEYRRVLQQDLDELENLLAQPDARESELQRFAADLDAISTSVASACYTLHQLTPATL